ncbi:MAG TPA: hypothetical protein DCL21_01190, partial [Alphaproteobacteria bacterium]|nr:hypothetical protein [Alphaproteobacteria bacterium]
MNKLILILASILMVTNAHAAVSNKTTDMVVATVNKQAITLQELKNRITLSKLLVNKKLSALEFNILKTQAIKQLIDEELKRQYAESKNVKVTSRDLKNAIAFLEKQRKLKSGDLLKNIPEHLHPTAVAQIKDSILQQKIVKLVIAKKVFVPDYEIDNLLENVLNQAHSKEYKISQIIINNSKNKQDDAKKITRVYEQLINGEDFKNVALAFSEGSNKLKGGSLGWFSLGELNQKLQKEVKKLAAEEFSKPIRTPNGLVIVRLDEVKITENIDTSETEEVKYVSFTGKDINKKDFKNIKSIASDVNGYSDFKKFKKIMTVKYKLEQVDENNWLSL